jgi:16S rRNA (guanine1207-N2)-methyltransferase
MDYGSELLLETFIAECPARTGRLLDLGCGYGPVGIVLKRVFPALDVTLSDINTRALELARQNARANQTAGVQIVKSDGLGALSGPYDFILTNPPIRAGKATVHRFFAEAREKLGSGGLLYVVIQKKQGAPSALKRLRELFADVEVIEHSAGYWVIRARA